MLNSIIPYRKFFSIGYFYRLIKKIDENLTKGINLFIMSRKNAVRNAVRNQVQDANSKKLGVMLWKSLNCQMI